MRGDLLQELAALATEVKKFYKRSSGCNFQSKVKSQKTQGRGKGCYSKIRNPKTWEPGVRISKPEENYLSDPRDQRYFWTCYLQAQADQVVMGHSDSQIFPIRSIQIRTYLLWKHVYIHIKYVFIPPNMIHLTWKYTSTAHTACGTPTPAPSGNQVLGFQLFRFKTLSLLGLCIEKLLDFRDLT